MHSEIASTARVTAALRALESARPDALVVDPWAATLAGSDVMARFATQPPEMQLRAASYTIIRTRVFDDWLREVANGQRQVVLLAAGFDTRAFRCWWPSGTELWELDQRLVLERKEHVLAAAGASPRCVRHVLAADLTDNDWPDALAAAGFRVNRPTVWLAEGLLPYLRPEEVEHLLDQLALMSVAGSRLAVDIVSSGFMAARNAYAAGEGPVFRFGTDDPVVLFAEHGWLMTAIKHPGDLDCDFGRWLGPGAAQDGFSLIFGEVAA